MDAIEIKSSTISTNEKMISESISSKNLSKLVNEIVAFIAKVINKGIKPKLIKQCTLDYFSNKNIDSKEIYNWLLNNQNHADSIFLLGYFIYYEIEIIKNNEKAFNIFLVASKQNHTLAQNYIGNCYQIGYGVTENKALAFE